MRAFEIGLLLSIVAALTPTAVIAATRVMPTHPEREKMSSADRREAVFADLDAVLVGPTTPTTMATAPHLSGLDGLCERDVITVRYERTNEEKRNSALKPVGIVDVRKEYHFLGYEDTGSHEGWKKACKALSGTEVYWATSDDDRTANRALAMLDDTVAQVKSGEDFAIDCKDLNDSEIEARCAPEFLAASSKVVAVSRCPDVTDNCYTFSTDSYEVTIARTYPPAANGSYSVTIRMASGPIIVT